MKLTAWAVREPPRMDTAAARLPVDEGAETWRVVVAAYFGVMVGFGSLLVFTFSTFLKPLTLEFGWRRQSVSAAFGFAAMTVAVCSPFLGRLLDRFGPRRIILPCMAIFGVTFASLGLLAPPIWHLYAIFVVLGMVGNATTQMGYSRAVSTWFVRRRGLALSFVMAGSGTGAIIFPPLAQAFITAYGWRVAYALLGGIVLLCGLPLTALFVRERGAAETPEKPVQSGASVGQGLRSRAFWLLIGTLFLGSLSVNGAITHLSPLLTDRGIGQQQAAYAASALGLFSFAGRLITGVLLDRFFGPRVGFFILGTSAAGILLLGSVTSIQSALVAAALIGFGLGAEADITPYLLSRYFGLRAFSTLYGVSWTAYAIAGAIGPVLMGRVFDATGSYTALLTLLSMATLLSAALFLGLPKYPADRRA